MRVLSGKAIMDRVVVGKLCFYKRPTPELHMSSEQNWREEKARFQQAQQQAVLELAALYDRAYLQVGEGTASIFAIHAMLLEDDDFVENVGSMIQKEGVTAEYAVRETGGTFAAAFAALDDPYMQARAVDMEDISRRVTRLLVGDGQEFPLKEPVILVSDEFLPSEVMDLNQRQLLGLASRKGSVNSHTSMLLRAYHIPAMTEVDMPPEWEGHVALMDGRGGHIYLDPNEELLEKLLSRRPLGRRREACAV